MQRTTITLDDALAAELDAHMAATGATSRSETIRDLVRRGLSTVAGGPAEAGCFGVISCTIDQSVRNLAARVPQSRLDRHDQTVAALSVPLDHSTSLDVVVMRGRVADVTSYAEALFLERGVMHGTVGLIPVAEDTTRHVHNDGPPREHTHLKVRSSF
ncbi:nickel-responsive transcriptional regulator NikR [Polymorphum gilvum]|uniref:Putative transcriptional regulator, CopG family n=1 Tax=Polymorphum gilvum (strain LMG 25793 / CGMCC 1.9160 / SL003B-26A1) TaxID=991905 RepID=F2J368_POLGS|nr:nickel-responsive transcriptional regulator NikR [Polymorphum gilvum]ADZ69875.1 Putative transcriptional regulator, CopG family [Polymorphum gilvum SL003B-26A1]